jgi:hypothetical protein
MAFREEAERIITSEDTLERKLNGLDAIHRRYRNQEIEERLKQKPKNSAFDRALGRQQIVKGG